MITVPRWLTLGLTLSFALFAVVFALVVLVSRPETTSTAAGLTLFTAAVVACLGIPPTAAPSLRRAGFIMFAGLALPVLGSAALNPRTDSFSNGAWYVSAVVCLVVQLLLHRRQRLAWLVLAGLVVQTIIWAGPWGLLRFGILATILMIGVVTVSAWAIGVTGTEISQHAESERQAATWRAAQDAFHTEHRVRLGNTALVAAPMLRTITEQHGRLTATQRLECRLLEQTIRDEIRGRQLLNRAIREQVMRHRRRGAVVQVNDDGGLDGIDPVNLDHLLSELAMAMTGLTSDTIIIRTAHIDSPTAITLAAMSVDPMAAALGLDDENDQVDLWLELPRVMSKEVTATPKQTVNHLPPYGLWDLLRPVLHLRLWYFRRLVRGNLYLPPVVPTHLGPQADRVAHIGSTDAVRVGVTSDALTTLSRVAAHVQAQRGRDFEWHYSGVQLLTARQATRYSMAEFDEVDAAVIVLGFSDVLLMTHPRRFERDLSELIASLRQAAGDTCGVILTGLAPMDEFRYTARLGRHRIRKQVERLNQSMNTVATYTPACVYVPPPTFSRPAGRPGDEQYSWALVHQLWSQAISPALVNFLSSPTDGR